MKLIKKYPKVKKQFIKERNQGISLYAIGIGSREKIWWKCEKGDDHIWLASPNQRTSGGNLRGCPACAGKLVVSSNSLETKSPKITKEWNYEKNGDLAPSKITSGSNKKVWWRCLKDSSHEWLASPKQRTNQNNTCPICVSLGYIFPEIAKQLHPTLNKNSNAFDIAYSSHTRVWWKCEKGFDHIWQSAPNNRTSNQGGCPICSGYKLVRSNSLAVVFPKLALQWNYEQNGKLTPDKIYAKSSKKVYWKCKNGDDHEWAATIKSRTNGIGCPICSGRKVSKSSSLGSRFPEISKFWHPTKNKGSTIFQVTPYSNKIMWWKCPKGIEHEWESSVANVVNGSTCPVCMGRKITEKNNLQVLYPELMKEWDYVRNTSDPTNLSPGTKDKAWWICSRDKEHKWFSAINDRTTKNSGCPICSIKLNVSEVKMLEILKEIFPKLTIEYRYRPKWLKRMELDVYIPSFKTGIEYQGMQHFKPIDFFGGEKTFLAQIKRDKLKKELCVKNSITLIEVYYDEELTRDLLINKILNAGINIMSEVYEDN